MASVTLHPFVYTRGSGGALGGAGFQFMRWSPYISAAQLQELERWCSYERPEGMTTIEDPAALPSALWRSSLADGWTAFGRTGYASLQSATRGGNFVASGFVVREDELEGIGHDVFGLVRWGVKFPGEAALEQAGTELRPLVVEPDPTSPVPRDPPFLARIEALIGASLLAPSGGRQVIVAPAGPGAGERLVEAVVALLPPAARRSFTFTTYVAEPRGTFHLAGILASAQMERQASALGRSYVVLTEGEAGSTISGEPHKIPAAARWIGRAFREGGYPAVWATHAVLRPLGAQLSGGESDLIVDAACDASLAAADALALLAGVRPDHPALRALAPALLERRVDDLPVRAPAPKVAEFVTHAGRLVQAVGLEAAQRVVERAVSRLGTPASPAAWTDVLAAMLQPAFVPSSATWRLVADGIRGGTPQTGWERFLTELQSAAQVSGRVDLCEVLGAVLAVGDRSASFLAAFERACASILVLDGGHGAWATALAHLDPCLEPTFGARAISAQVVGAWCELRAAGQRAPRRARDTLMRLVIEWSAAPDWAGAVSARGERVAQQLLEVIDEIACDHVDGRQRASIASRTVRAHWANRSFDLRARHALAARGWFTELETELWERGSPSAEVLVDAVLVVADLDASGLGPILRRWLDVERPGALARAGVLWSAPVEGPRERLGLLHQRVLRALLEGRFGVQEVATAPLGTRSQLRSIAADDASTRQLVDHLDRLGRIVEELSPSSSSALLQWEDTTARMGSRASLFFPAEARLLGGRTGVSTSRLVCSLLRRVASMSVEVHSACVSALLEGRRWRAGGEADAAAAWIEGFLVNSEDSAALRLADALSAEWEAGPRDSSQVSPNGERPAHTTMRFLRHRQIEIEALRRGTSGQLEWTLTAIATRLGVREGTAARVLRQMTNVMRRLVLQRDGDSDEGHHWLGLGLLLVVVALGAAVGFALASRQDRASAALDASFVVSGADSANAVCGDKVVATKEGALKINGVRVGTPCRLTATGHQGTASLELTIDRAGLHDCILEVGSLRCAR